MVDAKMVEKVGVATILANKATWPVTVQKVDRHPEDENVGNQGQTHRDEIKVETARDGFDPAPRAEKGPQRPRKQFRRPGGGRPREELNTTTSTNKPEKNSTLGGVNVEGTNLSMRLCSRFEGAFSHVVKTPLTPAWNYWSTVERPATLCQCRRQRGRDFPSINPETLDTS